MREYEMQLSDQSVNPDQLVCNGKASSNASNGQLIRSALLYGGEGIERLARRRVAVFGLGGVGGNAVEALARSGIGSLDLIDNDTISISNINRQIFALHSTVGRYKVDVARDRIRDINPSASVRTYKCFFLPETSGQFDFSLYDYVVDAIDTVTGKLEIICKAASCGVPVVSCMGTGNKMDPSALRVTDLFETQGDPLARVMRKELKKRGVTSLKVVCSDEKPMAPDPYLEEICMNELGEGTARRSVPGSTAFVPPVAGLLIAATVVRELLM
jgi:tRNA A37 threonylcarbamoyladenosine dehydratase